MRIVATSDTHMRHADIVQMPEGDIIIHAGDITSYGKLWEVQDFLKWFDSLDFKYKIFIAGNHDALFQNEAELARSLVPNSITYLEDESITIEGIKIYGSPYTLTFAAWSFMKNPYDEMEECYAKIPIDTNILVTHGPPRGILDLNSEDQNCGSRELANRIKIVKPKFHLFGHIHEGFGRYNNDKGTEFINASLLNDYYRYVNDPVEFTL